MLKDKQLKKQFKTECGSSPEKYYPCSFLEKNSFMRKKCSCKTYFWTVNKDQDKCGDPACQGGTKVTTNPAKNKSIPDSFIGFTQLSWRIYILIEPVYASNLSPILTFVMQLAN